MKQITINDIEHAMNRLSMLKFFPANPTVQSEIQLLLMRKVPHKEALEFLVNEFVYRIGEWHGPAELLAVMETRYNALGRPPEGYWSRLPGYTAQDGESRTPIQALLPAHEQPLAADSREMIRKLAARK
jgi:hypothetical protein